MAKTTLAELAELAGATAHGDGSLSLQGICSVENPRPHCVAMAETAEHLEALGATASIAVLHGEDLSVQGPGLVCAEPRVAFARLLEYFHPEPFAAPGIDASAVVDPRASVDPSAYVGPFCLIGPHAQVGAGCFLQAYVSLGEGSRLGPGCRLYAHTVVGSHSVLGADCRLEPWAQVGNEARLGDAVDLGAHTALGHEVKVESGAKFDNLVVVGPRTRVGALSLLVGQSSTMRDAHLHAGVILAGQSTVGPEAELCSGVQLGGRSLALGKLEKPGPYLGKPAIPLKEEMRRRIQERRDG